MTGRNTSMLHALLSDARTANCLEVWPTSPFSARAAVGLASVTVCARSAAGDFAVHWRVFGRAPSKSHQPGFGRDQIDWDRAP
jgi:hypothetical protein